MGDNIRTQRLDRGLRQKDLAIIIGVSTSTIENWERNYKAPQINLYPKIIGFLGYYPEINNKSGVGQIVHQYRMKNGLTTKALAGQLDLDQRTILNFENNNPTKYPSVWNKLIEVMPELEAHFES